MNGALGNLRNQNTEITQSDLSIFKHGWLNLCNCLDWNLQSPTPFFILNFSTTGSKHSTPLGKVLISMHDSPYTSVIWWWISITTLGGSVQWELHSQWLPSQDWASQHAHACLRVGEATLTTVWSTVARTVSLHPQCFGVFTFGITLAFYMFELIFWKYLS